MNRRAFTMIELLVVVSLLGLLAALIVPHVGDLDARDPGEEAVEVLAAQVAWVRGAARREGGVRVRCTPRGLRVDGGPVPSDRWPDGVRCRWEAAVDQGADARVWYWDAFGRAEDRTCRLRVAGAPRVLRFSGLSGLPVEPPR